MKKILMLGSSSGSLDIINNAKKRGLYTIVTDYLPIENSIEKQFADEYWMISTSNTDEIVKECLKNKVDYISAGISEFNIDQALKISTILNVPFFCSANTWHYSRHKGDFKRLCIDCGVKTAKYYNESDDFDIDAQDLNIDYPVVIKPVDNCGNQGMSYCYDSKEIKKCYEFAINNSNNKKAVIEQMLIGKEYIAHYVICEERAFLSAFYVMLYEPGYPSNCYSFTTNCVDCIDEYLEQMDDNFVKLLSKAGCKDGVAWVEMIRHTDDKFYALELAERPTGDLIDVPYKQITGFDTFDYLLDGYTGVQHHTCDLPLDTFKNFNRDSNNSFANSYILFSNKESTISKIEGFEELKEIANLDFRLLVKEGVKVDAYCYLAVIYFASYSFDEMCETIKAINNIIKIEDADGENIVIYYDDFATLASLNCSRKKGVKND